MNKYPKVLVGGPVSDHHEYCFDTFARALESLTYPNFDICFVDNSKGNDFYNKMKERFSSTIKLDYYPDVKVRLAESRNIVREKVLNEGYDYLFCLDQDVIPPMNVIEKLVFSGKKIVSGVYFNKFRSRNPANGESVEGVFPIAYVLSRKYNGGMTPVAKRFIDGKMRKIISCGTGCILIHRDVLEKIKFRCEEGKSGVDDVFFCIDANKLGFEIWLDTSAICEHYVDGRPFTWGQKDLKVVTDNVS